MEKMEELMASLGFKPKLAVKTKSIVASGGLGLDRTCIS